MTPVPKRFHRIKNKKESFFFGFTLHIVVYLANEGNISSNMDWAF